MTFDNASLFPFTATVNDRDHLSLGGLLLMAAHQASQVDPDRETVLDLPGINA